MTMLLQETAPALARPDAALAELVDRVRAASADGRPLAIIGHGSKAFYGGAVSGMALDTTALAGISSYEPTELVVTVRAGTPLIELEAALAEHGQRLPFEPPRFAGNAAGRGSDLPVPQCGNASPPVPQCGNASPPVPQCGTVGGMVAAGLSGPSRASAGSLRDHVLGASLLNGRGEVL
ncbi:FAD-binding protein, partial [Methylibium sp.]|uniref:FAD-binding protein n=1 Tax=Methylibium sp. TaxID=2067992 RepID=UPI00286A50CA